MGAMTTTLFEYCERGANPGLVAEPLNAVTNLAFLVAACAGARSAMRMSDPSARAMLLLLSVIVGVIGLGSLAFHTLATPAAKLADVLPIGVFMLVYLGFALRVLLGLSAPAVLAGLALFVGALAAAEAAPCSLQFRAIPLSAGGRCLNGSLGYVPALAALLGVGAALARRRHPSGRLLLVAGGLLAVSLIARTVDLAACQAWRHGTHFLWHLLNATLLYLLLRAASRHYSAAVLRPVDAVLSTITGLSKNRISGSAP